MCVCVCLCACICVYRELVGQWGGVRGQHASVCTPGGMGYECDKGLASAIFLLSPPPFFFMASRLSGNGVERFRYLRRKRKRERGKRERLRTFLPFEDSLSLSLSRFSGFIF